MILYRKHHYCVDPAPATADGFVRDVSAYPDATELMLAADVLVTDYSSMMFDFANTGRPMLFFTYDLDAYRDEIRGFYFDFAERAPGPLLRTTDELAAALVDLDGVVAEHADRYREFAAAFCELDDGRAAARVVDRLFSAERSRRRAAPSARRAGRGSRRTTGRATRRTPLGRGGSGGAVATGGGATACSSTSRGL